MLHFFVFDILSFVSCSKKFWLHIGVTIRSPGGTVARPEDEVQQSRSDVYNVFTSPPPAAATSAAAAVITSRSEGKGQSSELTRRGSGHVVRVVSPKNSEKQAVSQLSSGGDVTHQPPPATVLNIPSKHI